MAEEKRDMRAFNELLFGSHKAAESACAACTYVKEISKGVYGNPCKMNLESSSTKKICEKCSDPKYHPTE